MRYCTLGNTSSKKEEQDIADDINAGIVGEQIVRRVAEYVQNLRDLETLGFDDVSDAWNVIEVGKLVAFTGRTDEPTRNGGTRLFVAISLNAQGKPDALIKITRNYEGYDSEYSDLCRNAKHRLKNGTLT